MLMLTCKSAYSQFLTSVFISLGIYKDKPSRAQGVFSLHYKTMLSCVIFIYFDFIQSPNTSIKIAWRFYVDPFNNFE